MDEVITLRLDQKLEFHLNDYSFEIIDDSEVNNESIYTYKELESVEYVERKVNRIVTVGSFLVELIMLGTGGSRYRDRSHLIIKHNGQLLKIQTHNVDNEKIEKLVSFLEQKIISDQPTSQNT